MEWFKVLTLLTLLAIFVQDMAARSVYWLSFPLLVCLFIALRFTEPGAEVRRSILINYGFLLMQFLLVSAYFSLKNGHWVNITKQLLGWGDVLFLLCIACYLSVLNFLFFYMTSLIVVLLFGLSLQLIVNNKEQLLVNKERATIPLAGLQSLLFALFLAMDWWSLRVDVTSDNWLLNFLSQ